MKPSDLRRSSSSFVRFFAGFFPKGEMESNVREMVKGSAR